MLNAVLEIAEEIKTSPEYKRLSDMQLSVNDTRNFECNFEVLVRTVMDIQETSSHTHETLKCFRTLALYVYAADMYLSLGNEEQKRVVERTLKGLNADWTILFRLKNEKRRQLYVLKFGGFCLVTIALIIFMKNMR